MFHNLKPLYGPAWVVIWILLSLAFISSVSGCSTTSEDRYIAAQDAYIVTVETLISAYEGGSIDTETWEGIVLPVIIEGDLILDEYKTFAESGGDTALVANSLSRILQKLRPFVVEYVTRE